MRLTDVFEEMNRLALAGYYVPHSIESMGQEWHKALEHIDAERLTRAVDNLMAKKTDRWWPTLAELLAEVTALKAPDQVVSRKCPTCAGSTWIDAVPFRGYGLGETVYEGVRRCPDCRVPPPDTSHLAKSQMPISAAEQRARAKLRPTAVAMTEAEFLARLKAMGQHTLAARIAGPEASCQ